MTNEEVMQILTDMGLHEGGMDNWVADNAWWKFAKLVAQHEREVVANWIMDRGFATGHGDSIVDLLDQLEWQIAEHEREACAKLCDVLAVHPEYASEVTKLAALAIRARGNT